MKDSLALALLRVLRSERIQFPATPLLRECVDQYRIGRIHEEVAFFSELDKERLYDLLQKHPTVIPLLGVLHVDGLFVLKHAKAKNTQLEAVPEEPV